MKQKIVNVFILFLVLLSNAGTANTYKQKGEPEYVATWSKNLVVDKAVKDTWVLHRIAQQKTGILHVFTHGRPGELLWEGKWIGKEAIARLLAIKLHASPEKLKQIYIYGCEFAKGATGAEALAYLQHVLGITIAASDNITGKDGDWILEAGTEVSIQGMETYAYNLQCPTASVVDPDTDGDGVPNSVDIDDDNDGIPDTAEGVTTSPNAIVNPNFGTDGGSGGNLTGWTFNGTVTGSESTNTWHALGGGAVTFIDGAEGLNLYQPTVTLKPASNIPKTATFSVKISPVNTFGTPVNTGWGKISFWIQGTAGLVKLFTVFNPRDAALTSATVNVTEIGAPVLNLSVNGNYTVRSFAVGAYSTVTVTLDMSQLATSGWILAQRNNGTANAPANASGTAGADDFMVDDFSYTYPLFRDTDGDGIPDNLDLDSDNDGIPDVIEASGNTSLALSGCRQPDGANVVNGCEDGSTDNVFATPLDTDSDGTPDFLDLDSDLDGCPDATEAGIIGTGVNRTGFGALNATPDGLTSAGCFTPANNDRVVGTIDTTCNPIGAVNDTYSANPGIALTLNPLTGDNDPGGATLFVGSINGTTLTPGTAQTIPVSNGTVNVAANGTISFTADAGYTGTVSFPYQARNANGEFGTAQQIINVSNPLPVTLLSFTATAGKNNVLLDWTTVLENNNRGFGIERSADSKNWAPLGFVNSKAGASGNSNFSLSYQFIDRTPFMGKNYYRLVQTDFDQHTSTSMVQAVHFNEMTVIKISPNPVREQVSIAGLSGNETISVYNITGKKVFYTRALSSELKVNTSGWNNGFYLIYITDVAGERSVYKIMKSE